MNCKICGHENGDGNFCERCGAKIGPEVEESTSNQPINTPQEDAGLKPSPSFAEQAQTFHQEPAAGHSKYVFSGPPQQSQGPQASSTEGASGEAIQPNPYLESAKQNSKIYFDYFLKGLKSPLAVTQRTGKEQLLNGIISMAIFVILIPLMFYLSLGSVRNYMFESPFVDLVLKPVFWLALFMFLVAVYTFGAVKLSTNPKADLKEVIARFGTLLIPFIVIALVAFLMLFMESRIGGVFLIISLVGGIFTIPVLVTMSYKREGIGGLDTLYAILLIYVAIFLTTLILGDSLGSILRPTNIFDF
ncbi:hypothetical protein [Paenibacillus sp. GCM10028914]|uniref:hypothetical protein n=1 Tax=Paenibacillus sp. GCM10028914 TaxID=3273416 RepID=UPI003609034E